MSRHHNRHLEARVSIRLELGRRSRRRPHRPGLKVHLSAIASLSGGFRFGRLTCGLVLGLGAATFAAEIVRAVLESS